MREDIIVYGLANVGDIKRYGLFEASMRYKRK